MFGNRAGRKGMDGALAAAAALACGIAGVAAGPVLAAEDPVAYARQVVAAGTDSIMSRDDLATGKVHWTGADSSPPPVPGATIAVVPCPLFLSVCQALYSDAEAAAAAIGWKTIPIDSKGDPAVTQKGVEAAINRDVACVLTLGSPARDIRAQIARGKEKGISFVTGFADDAREFGGDSAFGLDQATAGALLAAYVVANGGGNVVVFNAPAFPQLAVRLQGFKDYIAAHAGDQAKVLEEIEFNVGAGAPDLITKMQAVLTRHPKDSIQWVIAPYDEAVVPLLATARQRDRTGIRGLGFDGQPVALESIAKDGGQAATISWGLEWVSWAGIDECNRAMNKAETGVNTDFPIQLTDRSNAVPGKRYDPGLDFKAKYKAMWDAAR
ncbi:MAG: substrate-binding domain-containing protein [Sneathiellaceae bacterium]